MPGKTLLSLRTRNAIRGNVFILGLTSFFTDLSSEMIYPLLPVFFTGLVSAAAAPVYIGLMDGLSESTSSLLKIAAGQLSDRMGRRKPLALAGYAISSLVRPLTALSMAGWHVVALRFLDRVGKGIRTSPRDALISGTVDSDVRGVAFSFQRLMDHAGAFLGPLFAAAFLYSLLGRNVLWRQGGGIAGPEEMLALRWLFGIALLPGLAATVVLWRFVSEPSRRSAREYPNGVPESTGALPSRFYIFLAAVTLFTLGNSSDLFLIYYAQSRFGLGLGWMIVLWMLLHLSKIAFSLPGGMLSDRFGRRPVIAAGWLLYIGIYTAMPFSGELWTVCALLTIYGAYYGMTEGAERALVADFVPPDLHGRAYGLYHGAVGLAALPASLLFGVFWSALGPKAAFLIGAALATVALLILVLFVAGGNHRETSHGV